MREEWETEKTRGCAGREKPPATETSGGGGTEPQMRSREPGWVEVPDDWIDRKRSDNPEIARIQEFLGKNVKEEVIRKHLLAEGIGKPGELKITAITTNADKSRGEIRADFKVVGMAWKDQDRNTGLFFENRDKSLIKEGKTYITRIIKKDGNGHIKAAAFGAIGAGTAMLPDNFADEYYLRAVPFLQKIGVETVTITAMTTAENPEEEEGRYVGAFIWPNYGYTNEKMNETRDQFLEYLQKDRGLKLNNDEVNDIKSRERMREILTHSITRDGEGLSAGIDFLLGDDGTGNYSRDVMWTGIIPNINDRNSKEMVELRDTLVKYRRK